MESPRAGSTGNPPKGSTENPPKGSTDREREFLMFYTVPVLSDNDLARYFRLRRLFGERPDFNTILLAEKKTFDDFPNLLTAVRNFHGKAAQVEKTHRKSQNENSFSEIRRITENEKALATIPPGEEKENLKQILYFFKGRYITISRCHIGKDREGCPVP